VGNKEQVAHVVYIFKAKLNQLEEHYTSKSRLATRKKEEKELIYKERLHTYFAHEDYELPSHNSDKIFRLLARHILTTLLGQHRGKNISTTSSSTSSIAASTAACYARGLAIAH
jgi:hypothetical protein